jgi:hypothetical protein
MRDRAMNATANNITPDPIQLNVDSMSRVRVFGGFDFVAGDLERSHRAECARLHVTDLAHARTMKGTAE